MTLRLIVKEELPTVSNLRIRLCALTEAKLTLDEEEREAMQIACSQVQEAPCKWGRCDVVMNSVEGLVTHVKSHLPDPKNTKVCYRFLCCLSLNIDSKL